MAPIEGPLVIEKQGYFFAGGEYRPSKTGNVMVGQMFVQYQIPLHRTFAYPIVMIHGGGQSGITFLGTMDGRPGWADYFVAKGFAVYVVDIPSRGRSAGAAEVVGLPILGTDMVSSRLTAPSRTKAYPQAQKHTQWPGTGLQGDPVFDQFYATQGALLAEPGIGERTTRAAGAALLDKIGPAVLLAHSQGGPLGWQIADARPGLVKGILAIEPNGPPFYEASFVGAPEWFKDGPLSRPFGITRTPLTYAPALKDEPQLALVQEASADRPDLVRCRLQAEPARQLVNLRGIPVLMLMTEASYHSPYDHCTSKFLTQAGVQHTFTRLEDVGIRGNGHLMMLEKNNLQVAAAMESWIREQVK